MNLLKTAMRSLARNRRRSLATLVAIALGFSAIALFAGYTHNVYDGLSRQSIHAELLGHLTLSKRGMSREGKLDPERYLLDAEDIARIRAALRDEPRVKLIAPRLAFNGLASNGRASTIFIAEGIAPEDMQSLLDGYLTAEEAASGAYAGFLKQLDPARPEVVELSAGLAELLHLPVGGQAALLVNTLGGQANALDITVGGTFNTGSAGSNDKFAYIPLSTAQSLLDAAGRADRLTLLLDDAAATEAMRGHLAAKLAGAGFDLEIETWQELSSFYQQVHNMFDMIFGFIFSIVLTVVVMSVANSMSMTVVERTREIGTLRSVGLKRSGVVRLFAAESLALTLAGCLLGLLLTFAVRYGVNVAGISYVPPNSAAPVPLLVDLDLPRIAFALALMASVGTAAALLPARRAARQPIIDALGHV